MTQKWITFAIENTIVCLLALFLANHFGSAMSPLAIYVRALMFHSFVSLRIVQADEIAAILRFGKIIQIVGSGLKIVPILSCQIFSKYIVITTKTIQRQFPDEPENIDGSGGDIVQPGKKFPIRVTHSEDLKSEDPLARRLTTETLAVWAGKIDPDRFVDFIVNIGSIEELVRQIRDTVETKIKTTFALKTVAVSLNEWQKTNTDLITLVETMTRKVGFITERMEITEINLPKRVNESMADATKALFEKRAMISKAEGEKKRLMLEGEGTASARKNLLLAEATGRQAFLDAEAIGFEKLRIVAGKDEGKFVQAMKVLEQGFAEGNTTFFDTNMIFNAVQTVESIITKAKGGI